MADQWYYAQQGRQLGPVGFYELAAMLRTGRIVSTDLVWREGMANWIEARTVPEFASHLPAARMLANPAMMNPSAPQIQYMTPRGIQLEYAGFWLRFVAYVIDAVILWVPMAAIGFASQKALSLPVFRPHGVPRPFLMMNGSGNLLGIIIWWLYFALMESSAYQASLGKLALGLIVTDESGGRLTFGRATGRTFAKYISVITFGIGYIMAGLTSRKQGLHDMIARALVLRKNVSPQ